MGPRGRMTQWVKMSTPSAHARDSIPRTDPALKSFALTYTHTLWHVCTHTHMCACACVYVGMYVDTCTHACTYIYPHTSHTKSECDKVKTIIPQ